MRSTLISILILILLFPSCKCVREKGWFGKGKDTLEIYQMRMDSIRLADSIKQAQAAEMQRVREQAVADSVARVQEQLVLEAQTPYHIIVGSFITPEYALEYADYYSSMGYQTKIYKGVAGFDLVSAMEVREWKEALKLLERFQDTVEFEAWIYVYPELQ